MKQLFLFLIKKEHRYSILLGQKFQFYTHCQLAWCHYKRLRINYSGSDRVNVDLFNMDPAILWTNCQVQKWAVIMISWFGNRYICALFMWTKCTGTRSVRINAVWLHLLLKQDALSVSVLCLFFPWNIDEWVSDSSMLLIGPIKNAT